jgi:UDP-glucose 4-epimerase
VLIQGLLKGPYVIDGGTGFIGQSLALRLRQAGLEVRVTDRRLSMSSDHGQATLEQALAGAAGCFHLSRETPRVLTASLAVGRVPVVLTSSAAVYGHQPDLPVPETAELSPVTAYGIEKLASEHEAALAFSSHGIPSLILRLFNIYGPRNELHSPHAGVVAHFLAHLAAGQPLPLAGDGAQRRDFLYIDDAVMMLIAGMAWLQEERGHAVLNACSGVPVSLLDLIALLEPLLGRRATLAHQPASPTDVRYCYGSTTRLHGFLRLGASLSLGDGLKRTWSGSTFS